MSEGKKDEIEIICFECRHYYEEPLHEGYCLSDKKRMTPIWVIDGKLSKDGCLWNPSRFKPLDPL